MQNKKIKSKNRITLKKCAICLSDCHDDITEFFSVFEAASVGPTPLADNERVFFALFVGKAQPMGVLWWRGNHANLSNIVLF